MKIIKSAIVSNSDVIKNYKTQRDKAQILGKLFIFKNNQPDAVLYSISEYEKFSELLENVETMNVKELSDIVDFINIERARIGTHKFFKLNSP